MVKGQGGQVNILDIKSIYCTVVYCTRSQEKGGRECVGSSRTVCVSFEIALLGFSSLQIGGKGILL